MSYAEFLGGGQPDSLLDVDFGPPQSRSLADIKLGSPVFGATPGWLRSNNQDLLRRGFSKY